MTCGFFFRSSRVCNLAPDCQSQHKLMTQKEANCIPRTCGRKNRMSFNGICSHMRVHNGHRSRGCFSSCWHVREALKSRMHAQVSLTTLSHSGTFFFCHSTNLFVAGHPFGQNLPSICTSNPNEMVDFLICLTSSTKNCLSNT